MSNFDEIVTPILEGTKKLIEYVTDLAVNPPKWAGKSWRVAAAIVAFGIGIAIPYYTVQSYSKFLTAVEENNWDRDTSYLQITNNYKVNIDSAVHTIGPTGVTGPTGQPKPLTGATGPSGKAEQSKAPDSTRTNKDTINTAALESAWIKENPRSNAAQWIAVGEYGGTVLIAICLILLFVFLYRLPREAQQNEDRDPQDLLRLYKLFVDDIKNLESPRRVKRFSNKVRIQYVLLRNLGLIEEGKVSGEIFMRCLFRLEELQESIWARTKESNDDPNDVSRINISNKKEFIHWLYKSVTPHLQYIKGREEPNRIDIDKASMLVEEIYIMNKDILFQLPKDNGKKIEKG